MAVSERFQGANVVDAGRLSPYWGEHVARYRFARPYGEGKTVLDIACGTGYGVGLLGRTGRFVVGVDIDAEAARQALGECGSNAGILLGDGLQLPFEDGRFDVVTTFETLEHLHDRAGFLGEMHRVLREGGTMLLSTPNANYSRPVNGKPANPFHVHEYVPDELRVELERVFELDAFLGQDLKVNTGIPPFLAAQQKLPRDVATQARLFGWKAMNKMPFSVREALSEKLWGKPFYPTEMDYNFREDLIETAPTLVAVCRK